MEPEREIEKLLRAYVRKRRADAGDPLKLHPATRRLLQDEVSRQTTKPEAGGTFLSFLAVFRRPAWVVGAAAVALIGVSLFLPALSMSKKKSQSFSTLSNLRQIGIAAQMVAGDHNGRLPATLDELSSTLGTRTVLTDSISGKRFVYVAGGKKLGDLSSNAVLAYSPAEKDRRAVLFADGRVALVSKENFDTLTNQRQVEFALADKVRREDLAKAAVNAPAAAGTPSPVTTAPASMPSAAPPAAGEFAMKKSGFTATQSLARTGAAANQQNRYRNVATAAKTVPVLQSFQVLQNGDEVSVVDRDGSVYNGTLHLASAERNEPAQAEVPAAPSESRLKAVQPAANQQQAVQNYSFRVTGTNRTLKQNVLFTGNVEALNGAITNTQLSFGGTGGGGGGGSNGIAQSDAFTTTNQQQELLPNSRVVGTAVIDHTNQIEINAVPVMP